MRVPSPAAAARAPFDIEHTRRELLKFVQSAQTSSEAAPIANDATRANGAARVQESTQAQGLNWRVLLGAGASTWWHQHPARSVVSLLQTATTEYARKRPLQVVTVAAVAGAAIVLFRPWRMISATALLVSVARSSNFSGMVGSLVDTLAQSLHNERKERP